MDESRDDKTDTPLQPWRMASCVIDNVSVDIVVDLSDTAKTHERLSRDRYDNLGSERASSTKRYTNRSAACISALAAIGNMAYRG